MLNGSLLALEADSEAVQAICRAHLVQTLTEAELRRSSPDAVPRALHALFWLGCQGPFIPFKAAKGALCARCRLAMLLSLCLGAVALKPATHPQLLTMTMMLKVSVRHDTNSLD